MKLNLYPAAILLITLQILPPFTILAKTHFSAGVSPVSEIVTDDTPKVILPITLVSFNAGIQNNAAVLNWSMVSELNSGHFYIEKSSDGLNFTEIGDMTAFLGHAGLTEYSFVDQHPYFGTTYYRIKLTEALEEERYLGVRKVNFAYSTVVSLYPNPVSGSNITLQTAAAAEGKTSFIISDMSGKIMKTGVITNYPQQIDIAGLTTGYYVLKLSSRINMKFQKQ